MDDLSSLTTRFGSRWLEFVVGAGGLVRALLRSPSGSRAEVVLHGAQVVSWQTREGREVLFCSTRARTEVGQALRGGIPIVFPQFGPGPLPSHGFARTSLWRLVEASTRGGAVRMTLQLESSPDTLRIWPHEFRLSLEIILGETLELILTCSSTGHSPCSLQAAFHTYFAVADIDQVAIDGLSGLTYLDTARQLAPFRDDAPRATIQGEVDRIYRDAPHSLQIYDALSHSYFTIDKWNLPDAVLWNPGAEKGAKLSDLAPGDFRRFVCLECGAIARPVSLNPGTQFSGGMTLRARV